MHFTHSPGFFIFIFVFFYICLRQHAFLTPLDHELSFVGQFLSVGERRDLKMLSTVHDLL